MHECFDNCPCGNSPRSPGSPVGGVVTGPDPRTWPWWMLVGGRDGELPRVSLGRLYPKQIPEGEQIVVVPEGSERARVIEELRRKAANLRVISTRSDNEQARHLDEAADWLVRGLDGESE